MVRNLPAPLGQTRCAVALGLLLAASGGCVFDPSPPRGGPVPPDASTVVDTDLDGVPDEVDNCPALYNQTQTDSDGDGAGDGCDNCVDTPNPDQSNVDGDLMGDACDEDPDDDGLPDIVDPHPRYKDIIDYYNTFDATGDDFLTQGGEWTYDATSFCQVDRSAEEARARLQTELMTLSDALVETRLEAIRTDARGGVHPTLGLMMRSRSIGVGDFDAYLCLLDLRAWRVQLLAVNDFIYTTMAESEPDTLAPDPDDLYHLRMTTDGTSIECAVLPDGPTLNHADETFDSGTAGFYTHRVSACFDYLLVIQP